MKFRPALFAATVCITAFAACAQDRPGERIVIAPEKLPAPYATPAVGNRSEVISRPQGVRPEVPQGFVAEPYVTGLSHPRFMALGPQGEIYLTESAADKVTVIRGGRALPFLTGFQKPSGIAVHNGALFIGDLEAVWRIDLKTKAKTRLTQEPFGLGGHTTRTIAFAPDGTLYLAIGSRSNLSEEPLPRASVLRVDASGRLLPFATGLRNPVGIGFYPGTNNLFVTVNERDGLGDDLPPDYFTQIRQGDFFGWPYAYTGKHPDPEYGSKKPDLVAKSKMPDVLFQAHSAPLGFAFYTGTQFPAAYKNSVFVALHGSWNAAKPTGYKVVWMKFANGKPENAYENFATGFWSADTESPKVWGRPAGLLVDQEGSLIIADDVGKTLWRVRYQGH